MTEDEKRRTEALGWILTITGYFISLLGAYYLRKAR